MHRKPGPRRVAGHALVFSTLAATLLSLFPPPYPIFHWWEAQASTFMLVLLAAGLLFFFVNYRQGMVLAFSCCALLCFVMHERTEMEMKPFSPHQDGMDFSAAHFRVPANPDDRRALIERIRLLHPDLLSLQGLPTDSLEPIHLALDQMGFTHHQLAPESDSSGSVAVYSRYPFDFVRPIKQWDDLSISGRLRLPGHLAFPYLQFSTALPGRRAFTPAGLGAMAAQLRSEHTPSLALGDFSCVPWSLGLSTFKRVTQMQDSRRVMEAAMAGEYMGLLDKPTWHILHSEHLQCTDFAMLRDEDLEPVGIMGTYRLMARTDLDVSQTN